MLRFGGLDLVAISTHMKMALLSCKSSLFKKIKLVKNKEYISLF